MLLYCFKLPSRKQTSIRSIMKVISKFHEALLQHLSATKYVLLNPIPITEHTSNVDVLFKNEELNSFIEHLKQLPDLKNITMSSSFKLSRAILKFKDNSELIINFVHRFVHNSITYLDEMEVMTCRVKNSDEVYIPCVEHIFERGILKNFLEGKGIGRSAFQYFSEFHILVQEDLLDYFNMKYGTSFSNIYQLTDFDESQRNQMVKKLKTIPTNRFIKKVNYRWHNFLGVMKQTRII